MTYKEAKPFLKEGMKIKVIKCGGYESAINQELFIAKINESNHGQSVVVGDYKARFCDWACSNTDELEILTNPDGSKWIHPDKQKLKVGDRVRVRSTDLIRKSLDGKIYTIKKRGSSMSTPNGWCLDKNSYFVYPESELEKIEKPEFKVSQTLASIDRYMNQQYMGVDFGYEKPFYNLFKPYQLHYVNNESLTQKVSKTMNSVVKALKDLKLSPADRILREKGFEDDNGKMTSEAREMMLDELLETAWDSRRKDIAKDLLSLEK